jgi:hypothetical protein
MKFLLVLAFVHCAFMIVFSLWAFCKEIGLIPSDPIPDKPNPPQEQRAKLPKTVSKMEWIKIRGEFQLIEVHDLDCKPITIE